MRLLRVAAHCVALLACVVVTSAMGQETTPALVAAAEKEGKVVFEFEPRAAKAPPAKKAAKKTAAADE